MKLAKVVRFFVFVFLFSVSCKNTAKKEVVKEQMVQQINLKKVEVGIEGMTCQIGCAKTIESKLSKTEGIRSVAVLFEKKSGTIVYDSNKISKDDISKKINSIAGGDIYSVTSVREFSDFE